MRESNFQSDIMDRSTDNIIDNVPSSTFKTKADIECKPFILGSMYITSTDTSDGKYYLHFPIKENRENKPPDSKVRIRLELKADPI